MLLCNCLVSILTPQNWTDEYTAEVKMLVLGGEGISHCLDVITRKQQTASCTDIAGILTLFDRADCSSCRLDIPTNTFAARMERAPGLLEVATMSIEGTSRGGGGVGEAGAAVEVAMDDEIEVAEEAVVGELQRRAPRRSLVTPTRVCTQAARTRSSQRRR